MGLKDKWNGECFKCRRNQTNMRKTGSLASKERSNKRIMGSGGISSSWEIFQRSSRTKNTHLQYSQKADS
jgi:hypothetical protein